MFERWYLGRTLLSVTHVFDVTTTLDRQLSAILLHPTMLANIARQLLLQARTAGLRAPLVEAAIAGDPEPLFAALLNGAAAAKGAAFGLAAAELLRLHRSGVAQLGNLP